MKIVGEGFTPSRKVGGGKPRPYEFDMGLVGIAETGKAGLNSPEIRKSRGKMAKRNLKAEARNYIRTVDQPDGTRHRVGVLRTDTGTEFLVDYIDFERVKNYVWTSRGGYAWNRTLGFLHRYLISPPANFDVDHINGQRWDNRRRNLEPVSHKENCERRDARRPARI